MSNTTVFLQRNSHNNLIWEPLTDSSLATDMPRLPSSNKWTKHIEIIFAHRWPDASYSPVDHTRLVHHLPEKPCSPLIKHTLLTADHTNHAHHWSHKLCSPFTREVAITTDHTSRAHQWSNIRAYHWSHKSCSPLTRQIVLTNDHLRLAHLWPDKSCSPLIRHEFTTDQTRVYHWSDTLSLSLIRHIEIK